MLLISRSSDRFFQCHLLQSFLRRCRLGSLNRLPFAARDAAVPFQLDMKHALVRRTQRFHDCVLRRRLMRSLQFFLKHCFWIGSRRRDWVGSAQFFAERVLHKIARSFQSTLEKTRAGNSLENIREQSMFAPAAALFFSATEAQVLAKSQTI